MPAFTSSARDGPPQSAPSPAISLENSLPIIAKGTSWSWEAFTNLDRQPLLPILHGLADFACATFALRKTSFSLREPAYGAPSCKKSKMSRLQMYCVRRWNHDRDEMTEEFVEFLDDIAIDGYVSVTRVHEGEVSPVLETGPGGVQRFAP